MSDISSCKVVRLNSELFPITQFEQQAYDHFGLTPVAIELAGVDILSVAADCDAMLVVSERITNNVVRGLKKCRVLSRLGAGTDKVDVHAATEMGIVVTNVADFCDEEQADHALALLLALVRRLPGLDKAMREGRWDSGRRASRTARRFRDRVLGLIGFGGSAKALARRAQGFGMRIMASRRSDRVDPEAARLGVEMADTETVVRSADYLSLHLPLNDQTRGMFDEKLIAQMKPDAFFINTARGAIVDETALAAAMSSGHLAGAGLDTFEEIFVHGPDGDPPQHPLLQLDNVIVTPHTAAFSVESSCDVGTGGVGNVATVLSGRWPEPFRVVNRGVQPRFPLT